MEAWFDTYMMLLTIGIVLWMMGIWFAYEWTWLKHTLTGSSSESTVMNTHRLNIQNQKYIVLTFIEHIVVKIQQKQSVDDEEIHPP